MRTRTRRTRSSEAQASRTLRFRGCGPCRLWRLGWVSWSLARVGRYFLDPGFWRRPLSGSGPVLSWMACSWRWERRMGNLHGIEQDLAWRGSRHERGIMSGIACCL